MKKHIFTLVITLSVLFAMSQTTIPNNGFESWTGGKPDNWTTNISGNVTTTLPVIGEFAYPVSVNFGSQTTDAHSGNYALKLMASNFGIPSTQYNYLIPGIGQLGSAGEFSVPMSAIMDLVNNGIDSLNMETLEELATLLNVLASGIPCESTPYDLKMWIKYLPQTADTMRIIAFSKLNGTPVSYAMYDNTETMSAYTQVTATFDNPYAPCDSVCIIILSGGMSTDPNTELYVDDVEFDYHVGITEHESLKVDVYPNPATDQFRIEPANGDQYQYRLMDITGRSVASGRNVSGAVDIDVRALVPGVYMLYIEQKNQTLTKKVVVR